MGDFRIIVEAVGGHGCGREAKDGEVVTRCLQPGCPDCAAVAFVAELRKHSSVASAKLEHWPVPGAAGTTRTEKPGPVDDLVTGVRAGSFAEAGRATLGGLASVLLLAGALLAVGCQDAPLAATVAASPSPSPAPSPTPRIAASCLIEGDRIVFGIGAKQERELRLRVFDAERTHIPNVFGTWSHNGPIQRVGPREGPTFAYWAVTSGGASVAVALPGTPGCQFEITIVESFAEYVAALARLR